ncbi:putative membrane protein [Babesia divergens]|uniref:Membrane protein n=1 Tax=Babesia divergens TaxID=32595 RepID=A0AAD9GFA8_BABDI|nr:putative membrane protein [Babesia divergens]
MKLVSTLSIFIVIDIAILLLLYFNSDKYCDVPLSSLPSSLGAHYVRKHYGYKAGLIVEVILLTASFFWMAVGTVDISLSTTCQSTSPAIWWTAFVTITVFW